MEMNALIGRMGQLKHSFRFTKGPLVPMEIWVVFAIALLFRLAFFFHHQAQGFQLQHDPSLYLALAKGMEHGVFSMFHPLDIPETTRMPGYPALIYLLGSVPAVLLVQVLFSALKIPIAYLIGLAIGVKRHSYLLVPPLLLAVEPIDIILSGSLLTESLFTTLLLIALVFLLRMKSWIDVLIAAIALASMAYLRPNGFHLALIGIGCLFFRSTRARIRSVGLFVFIMLFLLPWFLREHSIDGRFHLSDSAVVVASHFHVPEVVSTAGVQDEKEYRAQLYDLATATDWTDPSSMRAYFEELGSSVKSAFLDHPVEWTTIQIRKAAQILIAPGRGHINRHFAKVPFVKYAILGVSILFSLMIICICVVLLLQVRQMAWMHWLLCILLFFMIFSSAISTADARFKNPVMPLLLVLGAWAWEQWRKKRSISPIGSMVNPGSGRA